MIFRVFAACSIVAIAGCATAQSITELTTPAGAGAMTPFLLNRDGKKNEHGFVTLAPLPHGGVGATWLDGRNMPEGKEEGEMSIRYATVSARGTIASDVILDRRTCECCTTGMAMTANG